MGWRDRSPHGWLDDDMPAMAGHQEQLQWPFHLLTRGNRIQQGCGIASTARGWGRGFDNSHIQAVVNSEGQVQARYVIRQ